jgi:hypothetical protein
MGGPDHRWTTPKGAQTTAFGFGAVGVVISLTGDLPAFAVGMTLAALSCAAIVFIHAGEIGDAFRSHAWDQNLTLPALMIAGVVIVSGYSGYRIFNEPTDWGKLAYDYVRTHSGLSAQQKQGAYLVLQALPPLRYQDGNCIFPVRVENTGDLPVIGFRHIEAPGIRLPGLGYLSRQEEDDFMEPVEQQMRKPFFDVKALLKLGGEFKTGWASLMFPKTMKLNKDACDEVLNGTRPVYYAEMFAYIDEDSAARDVIYYAELCQYYDGEAKAVLDCQRHNFSRRTSF